MQRFVDQANHNIDFHRCIDTSFENRFTDWKITVLFYIAIHLIKALAEKDKKDIGNSHQEINTNINPENPNAVMKVSRKAWRSYQHLFKTSQTSRYNGISDPETFEQIMKTDYQFCLDSFNYLSKYAKGRGIITNSLASPEKPDKKA